MKTIRANLLAAIAVALTANAVVAQVIYYESFTRDSDGPFNGSAPEIRPGSETWIAANVWRSDKVRAYVSYTHTSALRPGAFLPFTPAAGKTYKLTMTFINMTETVSNGWFSLGFTGGQNTSWDMSTTASPGRPWIRVNSSNNTAGAYTVTSYLGSQTAGSQTHSAAGPNTELAIVLNTKTPLWKVEWFVNGASIRTAAYTTNPIITNVGFGSYLGAAGYQYVVADSFKLETLPDPGSLVLIW